MSARCRRIYPLNTAEKLITALAGSREDRAILIRDPNLLVSAGVIDNPSLTETEVESFCAMANVSVEILRHIGNHREWTKRYKVVANLVKNPSTPIGISLQLAPRLNPRDVPEALRKAARAVRKHRGGHSSTKTESEPPEENVLEARTRSERTVGKMIGIDLGTTKSCVAVMEGGVPQVIPNQEGARTTPSIVGFTAKGERLVGGFAKRQALTNPKNTVVGVKRLIGRKFDSPEATEARQFLPFELVESANGDVHIQIDGKTYSPPEISSFVLAKLKAAAEDYLGETVEEAIITVPAHFNDAQRQATKDAGLIAGLKVSLIINEPTAAALAYGLKNSGASGQLVAVYDLGGGTFDITILEMTDGTFMVRATGGDTYLGGEDFDQKIIDWLIDEFRRETAIDLRRDRTARQRLKEVAERAKCELSTSQETELVLPFISADASGPKHLNTVLTRQRYEELTDALLDRTIERCRRCLADAGVKPEQIDEVLLVGGQTRAPKLAEVVRKVFGKEPNRAVNPDEGVAMGAAIQTGILQGEVKDLAFRDVTPHTLGIETKDGTFTPLIDRNSTIPTRKSRVFTTVADNQTRVEVHVLQGESDMAADNKSVAKFELTNIPPAPRGVPQIEVALYIDLNGIVSVTAHDQATGRAQSMALHPSGGLSQAEVSRLFNETRAREDAGRLQGRRNAVARQLDALVTHTIRAVQALEGTLNPEEHFHILEAIKKAQKALGQGGTEELRSRLADMERAAAIIGQGMPLLGKPRPPAASRPRVQDDGPHEAPGARSPYRTPVPEQPPDGKRRDGWSTEAVEQYRDLVRTRLGERKCHGCGVSLESAALVQVNTCVGTFLNEFQLGDEGAAQLLAETDDLVVECRECGARNDVPPRVELPPPHPETRSHPAASEPPATGSGPAPGDRCPSDAEASFPTLVRAGTGARSARGLRRLAAAVFGAIRNRWRRLSARRDSPEK